MTIIVVAGIPALDALGEQMIQVYCRCPIEPVNVEVLVGDIKQTVPS